LNTPGHWASTFPRALQRSGYRTGYIGKWHMGESAVPRPGFDRWVSFAGQGRYTDPELNVDGRTTPSTGYIADVLTDHALEFLRQPADQPFCLIVAHKGPHSPFVPAPRHANLFADQEIERRQGASDDLADKPMLRRDLPGWPAVGPGSGPGDELIRNQLRTLVSIDEGLGRVLAALEQRGDLDRTVVIFTSDNGYFWGEHGLGDKRAAYEEALRVPLLIRYPALIAAPRKSDALVLNIDLAPTVLQLAGLPVPDNVQGKSLVSLLSNASRADAKFRADFLAEYTIQNPDQPRIPTWRAVRTERWKLNSYPTLTGLVMPVDSETKEGGGELEFRFEVKQGEFGTSGSAPSRPITGKMA
jgi:arylsulfatase A-like enzyme